MKPFERAKLNAPPVREFLAKAMSEGLTRPQAKALYRHMMSAAVWLNDKYQVSATEEDGITHLSIKRIDREPVHDWRDLQQIKNALCGPEREAVEIYPAESRKVDTANQYHLWVLPVGARVPFGFQTRLVTDEPGWGAMQRPGSDLSDVPTI